MNNWTKEQTKQRLLALAKEGIGYEHLAQKLNKEGHKTLDKGQDWSPSAVSWSLQSLGVRRKKPRGTAKPETKPQTAVTKWQLLQMIEACQDIQPAARKALLELVFREINK